MDLVYKNEKPLFRIAAALSGLFWLVLIVGTLGIALIYLLFGFIIYLFAQSAFISYIKGNGVRVNAEQYPDLHKSLLDSCEKVGVETVPDLYLLRADFFNALATKFLGKNMIVLFTDVVDALKDEPDAVTFYIGHELGHIAQKHLKWMGFLFPAMILPMLGAAHRRAQEYTCDRYGAYCCATDVGVTSAIAAMSAGDTRWKDLSVNEYLTQTEETSGFWMSFHEFTSDYPWLSKRMASALAFRRFGEVKHPRRSFFAGFLSIFVFRLGVGGGGSLILVVAMIGILAAIAIPAYQDYTVRAQVSEGLSLSGGAKMAVVEYARANEEWPQDNSAAGLVAAAEIQGSYVSSVGIDGGAVVVTYGNNAHASIQGLSIVLAPDATDFPNVVWNCYSIDIPDRMLPMACQSN